MENSLTEPQKAVNRINYHKNAENRSKAAFDSVKDGLLDLKISTAMFIIDSLKKKRLKNRIFGEIKLAIVISGMKFGFSEAEKNEIWKQSMIMYDVLSKKTAKKDDNDRFYDVLRPFIQKNRWIQDVNTVFYEFEQRNKKESLEKLLENEKSPFFLSSGHANSAKDHVKYQNKMFYDDEWEEKNHYSDDEKVAIRAYIKNHDLKTIEFVTGEGIWFGLRRNCHHYFKNIPLEEVMRSSCKALVKRYDMYSDGDKQMPEKEVLYKRYRDRFKIEDRLNNLIPCEKLSRDIRRTRMLLNKWRWLV